MAPEAFEVQVLVKALPALTDTASLLTLTVTAALDAHPFAVVVLVTV